VAISFNLPPDVENDLAARWSDLGQAAKEAFVIEGYRTRKFGIGTARRLLGLETRSEVERFLFDRDVPIHYSVDDLEGDRQTLARLLGGDD
jgi:hypothetical protein